MILTLNSKITARAEFVTIEEYTYVDIHSYIELVHNAELTAYPFSLIKTHQKKKNKYKPGRKREFSDCQSAQPRIQYLRLGTSKENTFSNCISVQPIA